MMLPLDELMEWVEARSIRNEDGCLVWQRALSSGRPVSCREIAGRKVTINIRRELWTATHGRAIPKKFVIVCGCDSPGCVEPDHLKAMPRTSLTKGRPLTAAHRIAISLGRRESGKRIKLTTEAVEDIRNAEGTAQSLREKADRYGICVDHARQVHQQKWWRDHGNPFIGLVTRAKGV
jgi:hypothetical protein